MKDLWKLKKAKKYLCEFKLYEYYDRRKDQNIINLIEEDNILSDNDSSQNDNVNRNNKEMKNTTSLFNTNKSRNIGNDLKKKSHLSMDDLNKMILKNTKKIT